MKPMNNDAQQPNSLAAKVDDLQFKANKGSFSALEVFDKSIQVKGIIRLKNFTTAPATGQVGDIAVIGGKLKICTVGGASPTWTVVGTQS